MQLRKTRKKMPNHGMLVRTEDDLKSSGQKPTWLAMHPNVHTLWQGTDVEMDFGYRRLLALQARGCARNN